MSISSQLAAFPSCVAVSRLPRCQSDDRKSITIGAEFTFQNAWALDLRYVNFFGAGRYNLLGDRDYISCNLKYSF